MACVARGQCTMAAAVLAAGALCLLQLGAAVDPSKFRTCEQGSFCRRYRKYVKEVEASGGAKFAHALSQAVHKQGHIVRAKVEHVNDASVKPLSLELRWYRDAAEDQCGIIRLFVTEELPLHPRFRLREGDVILNEADLQSDEVDVLAGPDGWTTISSKSPGDCKVRLRHKPFELDFSAGGKVLQKLNGRHLLNFETYRTRDTRHVGLVDATDIDGADLWEEHFGGHTDQKPRGPAAVGVDVTFAAAHDIFGLAEHATNLGLAANKFSEPYRFFNLDVFEYALDVPMALYGAVPFVTAVHRWQNEKATSSGFFFVNPSEGFVQVDEKVSAGGVFGFGAGTADEVKTWWLFESGVLDVFFFAGPSPQAVMRQYHTVTGMGRMPPISVLGKHQSRWNYVDIEDSININKGFDKNDIPYDVLWLDIEHTDGKKYFTWHPTHFAQPELLLTTLNQSKRKLVTIIDPHIKKEENYPVFKTLKDLDFFTKTHNLGLYDGWCWPGTSSYPDFCDPNMREQWAKFFVGDFYPHNRPDLYTWNDMNEPSVFNGPEVTMPRDNLHKCDTGRWEVEHRDVHNVYGYYHHGATVAGQLARAPDVRPFVLTRSFFAGTHRHSAMWTGDNMAKWEHLQKSVPMLVSLSLCGIGFAGADVPGFFYDPDIELFTRWHQLGIWYPFYRGHAHLETKRREPWMFGEEVTSMVRQQVTTRYQLIPTWYTLFAEWSMGAMPILRPIWYHNLDDTKAYDYQDEAFLVGESILVRSVPKPLLVKVDLYFPAGSDWFDYWDMRAKPIPGGQALSVTLDPGHVPVYVKRGHILFKRMRRRRSTGAMVADPYTILIYGEKAKGRIYIDDGDSHAYQAGVYIYDEVEFDGVTLQERPASMAWGDGRHGQKALPSADFPRKNLSIERIVFVGLQTRPSGARLVRDAASGVAEEVQIFSEAAIDGSFVTTVKKPTGLLGERWSIELQN